MLHKALLYTTHNDQYVTCALCAHRCRIKPDAFGLCGVRENRNGTLYAHVYGEVIANHVDPIEKKPLYHFLPGSQTFSIATVGCNFRCSFCQNWQISQLTKREGKKYAECVPPEDIVKLALRHKCKSIAYTYTEPTIYFEYALDCATRAREKGLRNVFVTNGYMTREAIDMILPYLDACNIDLKAFSGDFYKTLCAADLKPVCDTIRYLKSRGVWVEITTLLIPDKNDTPEELSRIAEFIAEVGVDIPWHISRFQPQYKYPDGPPTSLQGLRTAYEIGKRAGLRYVYLGNVFEGNETYCYKCGALLIERSGYYAAVKHLVGDVCVKCGCTLDGVF